MAVKLHCVGRNLVTPHHDSLISGESRERASIDQITLSRRDHPLIELKKSVTQVIKAQICKLT